MAHLLYSVTEDGIYNIVGELGKEKGLPPVQWRRGVVFRNLELKEAVWVDNPPYKWHLNERDLLREIPISEKRRKKSAIVFDILPNTRNKILLLKLKEMWGLTYDVWTPLLLKLELLYRDEIFKGAPDKFKRRFIPYGRKDRKTVFEFLYLVGGYTGERFTRTWAWGPVGRVNATLLFADALDYFLPIIECER
jgi:hypothetical protein